MRILVAAGLAAFAASCGKAPADYDAVFTEHEGAVFIGAGNSAGDIEALLLCEPNAKTDWPPVVVFMVLPEPGNAFGAAEKKSVTVDGRKVALSLSLKIDGRDFKLSDFWVQQHEDLKRAILVGGIEDGAKLAKAIGRAKTIEFAGDGRRMKIDVARADSRGAYAGICGAAAASASTSVSGGEAPVATELSNDEISAAIANRWRSGHATYEKNGLRYRIVEGVGSEGELPPDAQARGIKAYPGVGFEGDGPPFATALVVYAVFDDPAAASSYFSEADFNLGEQEVAEVKTFRIARDGYPVVNMNCVFVPDASNSVNCHYLTPDTRIVAMLLLTEGPTLDFSGRERAIDLVFANEAAADRASLAASASWAYLYDAVYR